MYTRFFVINAHANDVIPSGRHLDVLHVMPVNVVVAVLLVYVAVFVGKVQLYYTTFYTVHVLGTFPTHTYHVML